MNTRSNARRSCGAYLEDGAVGTMRSRATSTSAGEQAVDASTAMEAESAATLRAFAAVDAVVSNP